MTEREVQCQADLEKKDEDKDKMNRKTKKRMWRGGGKEEKKNVPRSTFSTGLQDQIGDQEKKVESRS